MTAQAPAKGRGGDWTEERGAEGDERRGIQAPQSAPEAQIKHNIGFRQALANGLTLAWRNVTQLKHSPEKLMDVTLMPIVFLLLFLYVFGAAVAGRTHAYL